MPRRKEPIKVPELRVTRKDKVYLATLAEVERKKNKENKIREVNGHASI